MDDYRDGDHWVISDRSGRKIRASESRKTWDGLIVHKDEYEQRHPQDLVRAVPERTSVVDARPRPIDVIVGPLSTSLSVNAAAGSRFIEVLSSARMMIGDRITIMLDNAMSFRAVITDENVQSGSEGGGFGDAAFASGSFGDSGEAGTANIIEITPALPWPASAGNMIFDTTAIATGDL